MTDTSQSTLLVQRQGRQLVMPGMATVHSHAFQRALRGRTQRRSTAAATFWSWRGLMFALAERLSPETIFDIARFAFVELAMSGVTAVGEFHYLHHDHTLTGLSFRRP
jgi:formimidoylglutamate deiminase